MKPTSQPNKTNSKSPGNLLHPQERKDGTNPRLCSPWKCKDAHILPRAYICTVLPTHGSQMSVTALLDNFKSIDKTCYFLKMKSKAKTKGKWRNINFWRTKIIYHQFKEKWIEAATVKEMFSSLHWKWKLFREAPSSEPALDTSLLFLCYYSFTVSCSHGCRNIVCILEETKNSTSAFSL